MQFLAGLIDLASRRLEHQRLGLDHNAALVLQDLQHRQDHGLLMGVHSGWHHQQHP